MNEAFQEEWEHPRMESLADLANDLAYRLPGCDDVSMRKALVAAYQDFCRESACLRSRLRVPLRVGVAVYPIPALYGGFVESVQGVVHGVYALSCGADYTIDDGVPVCVRLRRAPVAVKDGETLEVRTVEMPLANQETVPRGVLGRYGQFVVSGAFARLASMPNRMWSDPANAEAERRRFVDAIGTTRQRLLSGGQAGSGRVSAMNFGNVIV